MKAALWAQELFLYFSAVSNSACAAELHLCGYWYQAVDGKYSLVGVLSRDQTKGGLPQRHSC